MIVGFVFLLFCSSYLLILLLYFLSSHFPHFPLKGPGLGSTARHGVRSAAAFGDGGAARPVNGDGVSL
jgi:hypothetical protein